MKSHSFLFYSLCLTILFLFTIQLESHAESGQVYEVGTTNLNVRSAPSHDASVVGHLSPGDQVTSFGESNGWVQTYFNGGAAWIASQYLTPVQSSQSESASDSESSDTQIQISASGVNIRSGPGTDYSIIASATSGHTYQLIESSGDWLKISLANGESGWVAADFTSQTTTKEQNTETAPAKQTTNGSLAGYNIMIDPGHGGKDPGASGFNGIHEKEVVDMTTEHVVDHLRDAGATVNLTRTGDSYVSLDQRIQISNDYQTDAFVSIHYNAFPVPIVKGTSTYYYAGGNDKNLAQSIQSALADVSSVYDRGIRQGDFKVLRENSDLAVLIEMGFITNPDELETIQSSEFQNEAAEAITNGLINYFNN